MFGEGLLGDSLLGDSEDSGTFGTGQAQAQIIAFGVNKFAQAQADILQVYQGYSQAQARIAGYGWGQAQAYIQPRSYAQAQADIKQTYNAFAQAQGLITASVRYSAFGQAQAWICWTDTFTRTTSFGMGGQWTWVEYDTSFAAAANSTYKTDGSKLITTVNDNFDSYELNTIVPNLATVQFDVFIPAGFTTNGSNFIGLLWGPDYTPDGYYSYITPHVPIESGYVKIGDGSSGGQGYAKIAVVEGNLYTYKMGYDDLDTIAYKLWKVGDTEPGWQLSFNLFGAYAAFTFYNTIWFDLGFSTSGLYIDNVQICIPENLSRPYGFGQAQALINARFGLGQANALIYKTTNKHGQAQAKIRTFDVNKHAQARARIKGIGVNGYGQAQAQITVTWRSGQAQGDIVQTYYGFGQAQARIADAGATTFDSYAQAQAWISTHTPNAQAQARIGSFWDFAQAQAYMVKFRGNSVGNARARIKAVRFVWGQAQAWIAPRVGVGQAQAKIFAAINTVGQAQARILVSYQKYGQAQAQITYTLKTGQAQGLISSAHKNVYGQAQARVTGKTYPVSQAQARITAPIKSSGQAQCMIQASSNSCGQAQGSIKRTIAYGQAQGYVYKQAAGNLVRYNGYYLPGYLQSVSTPSEMTIEAHVAATDGSLSEYTGLLNKEISIEMKLTQSTYAQNKDKVLEAGSMLRSNRADWTALFINNPDKYYLALTSSIESSATAGSEKTVDYSATFECKPWLYGVTTHTLTGNTLLDTDAVSRTYLSGTWTPVRLTITGTNVTVSGYTSTGDFTGFISVSGAVTNLTIDTETFDVRLSGEKRNELINNYDYEMYVGPGQTVFAITGADEVQLEYEDRWNL